MILYDFIWFYMILYSCLKSLSMWWYMVFRLKFGMSSATYVTRSSHHTSVVTQTTIGFFTSTTHCRNTMRHWNATSRVSVEGALVFFFYIGMDQDLLIPFLGGWTSIYQLFWGSLGTRVLTHPHIMGIFFQPLPRVTRGSPRNDRWRAQPMPKIFVGRSPVHRGVWCGLCSEHPWLLLPSGKHTKSYWKWPFIVDLPIENGDFP